MNKRQYKKYLKLFLKPNKDDVILFNYNGKHLRFDEMYAIHESLTEIFKHNKVIILPKNIELLSMTLLELRDVVDEMIRENEVLNEIKYN